MLKDLSGRVVPHPTEYLVMVGDHVTPITKRISYTRVAQFVHKSHAQAFAKSITSFHTAVIEPEYKRTPVGEPAILRPTSSFRGNLEGWDG